MTRKPQHHAKRTISARFLWLVSVLAAIVFFITFAFTPLFPIKWSILVFIVLAVLMWLTFFLSVHTSPKNMFTKVVNIVMTVVLFIGSIAIPYEVDKVSNLFNQVVGKKALINVYRMSDAYLSANPKLTPYSYDTEDGKVTDLSQLEDALFITSMSVDADNSEYALMEINKETSSNVKTMDRPSYIDAAEALYNGEGNFLIMPSSYESVVSDSEGYENFAKDTTIVYSFTRIIEEEKPAQGDTSLTTKPFSIFFGGNDQTGELSLEGRTDVCMMVTVNPNTHQVVIVNLPRDSYVPNPYYNGAEDKLTHLGLKGISNTLKGLGNYIDEPINNYLILNFDTFQNIIGAIDGVDIVNPYSFTALDDEYFPEGEIHLDPVSALMYVRERYSLPDGDFGRNMHQQMVMEAIIDKITSPEGILKFNSILDSMQGQFLTNLTSDALYGLVNKQLNDNMSWNIVSYHVIGETGMEICASAPGQELSIVYPYPNQVEFVKSVIDDVVNGENIEQGELPEGSYNTQSSD